MDGAEKHEIYNMTAFLSFFKPLLCFFRFADRKLRQKKEMGHTPFSPPALPFAIVGKMNCFAFFRPRIDFFRIWAILMNA
jgi:hypothetical protein